MEYFLVTNNPEVEKKYPHLVGYSLEGPVIRVFLKVRDLIHRGHRLLTHPLSGSLKPGRIPYKTVFLGPKGEGLAFDSLQYIENSIAVYYKTVPPTPIQWTGPLLADYAAIDLSHVEAALESLGF
ncbi:MAG: GrdX family protein [bacterium]|jgi:hypothetical protein